MSTRVKKGQLFFPVRDAADDNKVTLVPVSKSFYSGAYQEINRKRKRLQCGGECRCPRQWLWKCDVDCDRCRYHIPEQSHLHIDAPVVGSDDISIGDTIEDGAPLPEDIAIDRDLLDALYRELEALDPEGRRICELLSRLSERDAAEEMGMSRSSFKRHWTKVKRLLAERLRDFR